MCFFAILKTFVFIFKSLNQIIMKLQQIKVDENNNEIVLFTTDQFNSLNANLVIAFGERLFLEKTAPYQKLKGLYPNANIVTCST